MQRKKAFQKTFLTKRERERRVLEEDGAYEQKTCLNEIYENLHEKEHKLK